MRSSASLRRWAALLLFTAFCVFGSGAGAAQATPRQPAQQTRVEGPVAIMPVIFRDTNCGRMPAEGITQWTAYSSVDELLADLRRRDRELAARVQEWTQKTGTLAIATRQYLAALLGKQGVSVVPFADLDPIVSELMPEYWHEDSYGQGKLKSLAERSGAHAVVLCEIVSGPTHAQGGPHGRAEVWTCGWLQVFGPDGLPTHSVTALETTAVESTASALGRLALGAAIGVVIAKEIEPGPLLGEAISPGVLPPDASKYLPGETKSLQRMITNMASSWLQEKHLQTPEPGEVTPLDMRLTGGFAPYGLGRTGGPISVSPGMRIAIIAEGGTPSKMSESVKRVKLEPKRGVIEDHYRRRFERESEQKTAAFASKLAAELESICKDWDCRPVVLRNEDFAHTATWQDVSLESLRQRAAVTGSDIVIFTQTNYLGQGDRKEYGSTFVKVLDLRSAACWERPAGEDTIVGLGRLIFGSVLVRQQ